jgi:dipeptidyl aminopeptidase/acylaminoacyl peptidase
LRTYALAALLCTAALALPVSATRLHVADLSKIVRLTDPEISPDGKSIVVVAGHANLDEDRTDTELILVDVASHTTRVLDRNLVRAI